MTLFANEWPWAASTSSWGVKRSNTSGFNGSWSGHQAELALQGIPKGLLGPGDTGLKVSEKPSPFLGEATCKGPCALWMHFQAGWQVQHCSKTQEGQGAELTEASALKPLPGWQSWAWCKQAQFVLTIRRAKMVLNVMYSWGQRTQGCVQSHWCSSNWNWTEFSHFPSQAGSSTHSYVIAAC